MHSDLGSALVSFSLSSQAYPLSLHLKLGSASKVAWIQCIQCILEFIYIPFSDWLTQTHCTPNLPLSIFLWSPTRSSILGFLRSALRPCLLSYSSIKCQWVIPSALVLKDLGFKMRMPLMSCVILNESFCLF